MDKAKKIRTRIIICNIIFGLLFYPSLFITGISAMMFDAPGSENPIYTIMLFMSIASFPLLAILSIPASWIAYKLKKYNIAKMLALSPLLSIVFFAISFFLLNIMCNGSFGC